MQFLAPLFLALGLLAAPIVLLYMLKLRRRDIPIPSTILWQMVLRDREANAPWQRLRRNLLLLLQLLLLALLVLALARPFLPVPVVASGQVTVLLDASVSMQATDGDGTRFDQARDQALALVNGLTGNSTMTLIRVAEQPEVLVTASNDANLLREALNQAQPSYGAADWSAALALAAAAATNQTDATTVIISDGGLPPTRVILPGTVRYVPIGSLAENVGIEALSVRADPGGPQLFAQVHNYGSQAANPILTLYLGDQIYQSQQLQLAPGTGQGLVWVLPDEVNLVRAELSPPASNPSPDYLATDNVAWAVYAPPTSGRVLYVSDRPNMFVEQILAALPGVQAFRLTTGQGLPTDPFDLFIFDEVWPDELPNQNVLLINPPTNPLFTVGEDYLPSGSPIVEYNPNSTLNQFVTWESVSFLAIRTVEVPDWATVEATLDGRPLLFSGVLQARRLAVLAFDPRNSDMPLQIAFPILFSNLIEWLTPNTVIANARDILRVGDTVTILPDVSATALAVRTPTGQIFTTPVGEGGAVFAGTTIPGFYTVSDTQGIVGYFAVNVFLPTESEIAPQEQILIGQDPLAAAEADQFGEQEFWPWLVLAGLILLFVEWWAYHRRGTLPAMSGWRGWFRRRGVAQD